MCATPPNILKLGDFGVKVTAKTNKYLGMSCYIQVEYSVFLVFFFFFRKTTYCCRTRRLPVCPSVVCGNNFISRYFDIYQAD